MPIDTQVILVSGQPTPNITPALDPELKPKEVVMLVSPDMRQRADWLAEVLQPSGLRIRRLELADPYDVPAIRDLVLELLSEREHESIALNVTGGTKLMAIAAYEVFSTAGKPIFYVHPEEDRLIWMHPANWPPRQLANRVKLPAFLKAHGANLVERPALFCMTEDYRRLAEALVLDVSKFQSALATVNWAAMRADADRTLVSPDVDVQRPEMAALLDLFEKAGVLSVDCDRIHFANETARFFANGGWLEQHVYSVAQALRREISAVIQDVRRGLEVERTVSCGQVRNELDVAFLAHNRLHVIECKTRKFSDETGKGGVGADAVYKLEALVNLLGGLKARAMLVSYQPLSPAVLDRARDYRILTCVGTELPRLRERLLKWLS